MRIKLHLSQTPLSGKVTLKAAMAEQLPLDRGQADEEWRNAPADQMLRSAHLAAEARMAAATCPGERSAGDHQQREQESAAARVEAEKALARLEVLRDMVGAKVEELQRRLAVAKVREQLRRVSDASEAVRPTVPREVA